MIVFLLLRPRELRHRRRVERRRRHRPDHHLARALRAAEPRRVAGYAGCRCPSSPDTSPSFAARIRELEERALSPLAVRSYETRGRLRARGRVRRPHAVPARPRPDRPLQAVPAAEGQDAGLHRPGRRPLPHAHDPHARDDRHRPRRRPRAAPERGSRRGDRARPRHRPHAVRPRRRGGARRGAARALRRPVPAQRAVAADRRAAEPHLRGPRRDPHAHRRAGARDARGQDRPHRRPRRLHQPRHRRRDPLRHPRAGRPAARRDRGARRRRARSASTRSSTT